MLAKLYRIRLDCKKICAKNSAVCAKNSAEMKLVRKNGIFELFL